LWKKAQQTKLRQHFHEQADKINHEALIGHRSQTKSIIIRVSFFNQVNFLVVSLNDMIFCKNSE